MDGVRKLITNGRATAHSWHLKAIGQSETEVGLYLQVKPKAIKIVSIQAMNRAILIVVASTRPKHSTPPLRLQQFPQKVFQRVAAQTRLMDSLNQRK